MLNRMARALLCLTIIISATGYCFAQATGKYQRHSSGSQWWSGGWRYGGGCECPDR